MGSFGKRLVVVSFLGILYTTIGYDARSVASLAMFLTPQVIHPVVYF